jgi:3-isopropylmalate dehydratase small subunit
MSGTVDPDARVPTLFGIALTFADHLAARDVLPARFAAADDAAGHLFADLDAGLAARIERGAVLVAGHRTGHGEDGASAARALAAAGFVAVVAASFADGFDEHCLAGGLAPLEVDAPFVFHTGQRVRINCEAGTIANLSSGDRLPIRNATEPLLARLRVLLGS